MERKTIFIIWGLMLVTTLAIAAGPQTINYQGYLRNSDGTPVSTATSVRFSLYSSNPARNNPVWSDIHTVTPANGIYSVRLGSQSPITAPFDVPYYLGIQVGSDAEMPLQLLASVPYAMRAAVADISASATTVADSAITDVKIGGPISLAKGGTGASAAAPARTNLGAAASGANADITSLSGLTVPLFVVQGGTGATNAATARINLGAAASGANTDITSLSGSLFLNNGKVGIGTVTPAKALDVAGDAKIQVGQFMYVASGAAVSGVLAPSCSCNQDPNSIDCPSRNYSPTDVGTTCYDVYDTGGWEDPETGEYFPAFYSQPFIRTTIQPLLDAGKFGGIGINKANPVYDLDVNGTLQATKLIGDGSRLTNVTAANVGATGITGVVGVTQGGTGTASQPTAAGQYLRSSGVGRWGVSSIQAADLPSLSGTYVDLTSPQTIGGSKTFSDQTYFNSPISVPLAFEVVGNDWLNTKIIRSDNNGGIFMGINAGSNTNAFGNSAFGNWALTLNYTGTGNTAIGNSSLYNSRENYNTAIGYNALGVLSYGSSNIAIGYDAGSNIGVGSGNIYIGNSGVYTVENNTIRIGTSTTAETYLGGIYGKTSASGIPVIINSSGKLGTTTSSRRFKEDIQEMGDASAGLMKLRPVTFHYKPEYTDEPKQLQYGLIAEEVAEVYPGLVNYDDKGQVNTVYYQFVNAMLLNEVQKQHRRLDEQQTTIDQLKGEIAELKRLIAR